MFRYFLFVALLSFWRSYETMATGFSQFYQRAYEQCGWDAGCIWTIPVFQITKDGYYIADTREFQKFA